MNQLITYLSGKKTYLAVLATIGIGIAQALGYMIPDWMYAITGALGLGAQRLAIQKQSAQTTTDVSALLQTILDQVDQAKDAKTGAATVTSQKATK